MLRYAPVADVVAAKPCDPWLLVLNKTLYLFAFSAGNFFLLLAAPTFHLLSQFAFPTISIVTDLLAGMFATAERPFTDFTA